MPDTADDKVSEIRTIYFSARPETVERDIARAVAILKSMATEEERERASVFMEGLAEMRANWARRQASKAGTTRPMRERR